MRVLVTGGAGFIGSHLARRLLVLGHQVVVVDNLTTGRRESIPSGATFIETDVSDPDAVEALPPERFDAVCHLAAQSSGPASADMPYYDLQVNAASTLVLSRWCLARGVPRFLYASSMAIYGNPAALPVSEAAHCAPVSYYGVSKLASEHLLRLAAAESLSVTIFRMFSVYGPGQDLSNLRQGIVSVYLAYLLRGVEVPVTGSLDRFRDLVYIDDVVDVWLKALLRPSTASPVYNIGSGKPTTVKELLKALLEALALPTEHPIRELAGSPSDQFGLYADTTLVRRDLEWQPTVPLAEGLRLMVESVRSGSPRS